jgi:transcription initiation factor TFIID TATA-box-binding protein
MTPTPQIHNVVATIQIKCKDIDIDYLSRVLPFTTYDKTKFAAITIRLADPVCTCLLFTSGKLVVTGASSWNEGLLTAYCIKDILQSIFIGETYFITSYEVQNIVAHVSLDLKLHQKFNLDNFYDDYSREITYQKNMFPGLIYRALDIPVVLLCFSSGKIVITGGKQFDMLSKYWEKLWPRLQKYIS